MQHVRVDPRPIQSVTQHFNPERLAELQLIAPSVRSAMKGRLVWNVSLSGDNTGAFDMVQTVLSRVGALGVNAELVTVSVEPEFNRISSALRLLIYGFDADPVATNDLAHDHYRAVLAKQAAQLVKEANPADVIILHDPATLGMAEFLANHDFRVLWRLHIGTQHRNAATARGWQFLQPYLQYVDRVLVTSIDYLPPGVDPQRVVVMSPSIDANSPRNVDLTPDDINDTLSRAGLSNTGRGDRHVEFSRADGTKGAVRRHYDLVHNDHIIDPTRPVIAQVSHWDKLKDMPGVMQAFDQHCHTSASESQLILAGPLETSPGGLLGRMSHAGYSHCVEAWEALAPNVRDRIHLIRIPRDDPDEHNHLVNVIQRRADIVVHKSLAEGFGLSVAEALWKAKPVIASAVGGLATQITHNQTGVLINDPHNHTLVAQHMTELAGKPTERARLGTAGRQHVRQWYLGDRHLLQFADLLLQLS